ncbi:phosphotransferase family protein [Nocardioides alcanivorans]|uniref:phosphotransferase family protein n=1 Tax=Nocardioides alcanivorans TaxID=2897352 RepID=UPI001F26D548|nr:phosphotransferase family protein [Nocardioides alcanivorans]
MNPTDPTRHPEIDGVPAAPLRAWLTGQGLLTPDAPALLLTRLAGGSSNLTVRVQSGDADWVLRRAPVRGGVGNAHDMLREHRIQQALTIAAQEQGRDLALPTVVAPCEDEEVIGAPFYLMERLDGFTHSPATLTAMSDGDVHRAGLALATCLAQVHAVDPSRSAGFDEFRRPEPYADRQLRRWQGQWVRSREATGLGDEPALDRSFDWLVTNRPPPQAPRIVHGDYAFANVMFHRDRPTVVQAVLDWELTSLGDPLADLGILCAYFSEAGRIIDSAAETALCHPTTVPALPGPDELAAAYAAAGTGADLEHLGWYVTLATARLAVIVAGALIRLPAKTSSGVDRRSIVESQVRSLAEAAEAGTRRGRTT